MDIDLHADANRRSYSGRQADDSCCDAVRRLLGPLNAVVVDVGCGGGTYTRAWHDLGAAMVLGVDFSRPMLDAAGEAHAGLSGVDFRPGEASATGLADGCADVAFERALVHHTPDLTAVAAEAFRVLRAGGTYLIQDRTAEDAAQPGSPTHSRGWLFVVHPLCSGWRTGAGTTPRCWWPR